MYPIYIYVYISKPLKALLAASTEPCAQAVPTPPGLGRPGDPRSPEAGDLGLQNQWGFGSSRFGDASQHGTNLRSRGHALRTYRI